MTWEEAEQICQDKGSHLLGGPNEKVHDVIYSGILQQIYLQGWYAAGDMFYIAGLNTSKVSLSVGL